MATPEDLGLETTDLGEISPVLHAVTKGAALDGVVDDTVAIQTAKNAIAATGGTLHTGGIAKSNNNFIQNLARAVEHQLGTEFAYVENHNDGRPIVGVRLFQGTELEEGDNGYKAYGERLEVVTKDATEVVSTVGAYFGVNALSTHSEDTPGARTNNRTNQVAVVANASSSTTTASVGIEALNAIVHSAYTGDKFVPIIGVEADMSSARDAGFFDDELSYLIGFSAVLKGDHHGTAAYATGVSTPGKGWRHGAYLPGCVEAGVSILGGPGGTPNYGLAVGAANTAGVYVGSTKFAGIGHNDQDTPDFDDLPSVGLWLDRSSNAGAATSLPLRMTGIAAVDTPVEWDVMANGYTWQIKKAGTPVVAFAPNQIYMGSDVVVGVRKTGWATPSGTKTRTTYDAATVTLPQLAERVGALISDLTSHGLIGA